MNRKIDYFVAPVAIVFAGIALYLAITTNMNWLKLYAISGIGGCFATMTYALYMIYSYKKLTQQYQVEY